MGLFDFLNKAQEKVDDLQRKTEEWQDKINQMGKPSEESSDTEIVELEDVQEVSTGFLCPICGNEQPKGKKKTAYGEICSNCVKTLKEKGISHREAKHYTQEQIFALCDTSLNAIDIAEKFIVSDAPVALKKDEHCYYAGIARGGKIKTLTTGYKSGSSGYSVRVMKNVTYRSGGTAGHAVREQVLEMSQKGTFVITGNRFILMTTQYGFELPAHKVGNIELRPDGIALYAGSKSHIVVTDDVKRIATIIRILSDATTEYEQQKQLEENQPKKTRTRKKTEEKTTDSTVDEIRKYKQLADEGIISLEEFEMKKKQLLGL